MKKTLTFFGLLVTIIFVYAVWWKHIENQLTIHTQNLLQAVDKIVSSKFLLKAGEVSVTGFPFRHSVVLEGAKLTLNPLDRTSTEIVTENPIHLVLSENEHAIQIHFPDTLFLRHENLRSEIRLSENALVNLTLRKPLKEQTSELSLASLFSSSFTTDSIVLVGSNGQIISKADALSIKGRFILHDQGQLQKTQITFAASDVIHNPDGLDNFTVEESGDQFIDYFQTYYERIGSFNYSGSLSVLRKLNESTLESMHTLLIDYINIQNDLFEVALDGNIRLTSYGVMLPTGVLRVNLTHTAEIISLYSRYAALQAEQQSLALPGVDAEGYAKRLREFLSAIGSFYNEDDIMLVIEHSEPGSMTINTTSLADVISTYQKIMLAK